MKYAWIKAHREEFEVVALCRVLEVSHSGFSGNCPRPHSVVNDADMGHSGKSL